MKKIGKLRLRRTFRVAQLRKRDIDLDWRSWWSQRPSWNCPKRWLSIHVHFADLALLSSLPTSGLAGKPKSFISRRAKRHQLEQLRDKCTLHSWKEMEQLGTLFEILRESRLPGTRLSKQPKTATTVRSSSMARRSTRQRMGAWWFAGVAWRLLSIASGSRSAQVCSKDLEEIHRPPLFGNSKAKELDLATFATWLDSTRTCIKGFKEISNDLTRRDLLLVRSKESGRMRRLGARKSEVRWLLASWPAWEEEPKIPWLKLGQSMWVVWKDYGGWSIYFNLQNCTWGLRLLQCRKLLALLRNGKRLSIVWAFLFAWLTPLRTWLKAARLKAVSFWFPINFDRMLDEVYDNKGLCNCHWSWGYDDHCVFLSSYRCRSTRTCIFAGRDAYLHCVAREDALVRRLDSRTWWSVVSGSRSNVWCQDGSNFCFINSMEWQEFDRLCHFERSQFAQPYFGFTNLWSQDFGNFFRNNLLASQIGASKRMSSWIDHLGSRARRGANCLLKLLRLSDQLVGNVHAWISKI